MADIQFRTDVRVEVFPDRINRLMDSPDGPVGRIIKQTADNLLQVARTKVGTKYSGTTGKPKESRPRSLKDSGSVVSLGGASYSVRFDHPIAFMHHEGAGTHPYPNKGERSAYYNSNPGVWNSPRAPADGHFYAIGPFTHPGHSGNPFLTDAAAELGLRASGGLRRGTEQVPLFRSKSFF